MPLWNLLSITWTFGAVWVYGSGQVEDSCGSIKLSLSEERQLRAAPYFVAANQTTFQRGDVISVTLTAERDPFVGFLLEAQGIREGGPLGSFTVTDSQAQPLNCSGLPSSAVSHSSDSPKTSVRVLWTAPQTGHVENLLFSATFVQNYSVYWDQVKSSPITYKGIQKERKKKVFRSVQSISSDGCGNSKVCLSDPSNCNPASTSSCYFMSVSSVQPGIRIEMSGLSSGYVAIGFSDDTQMGYDDIYICGYDSAGNIMVQHAFSTGTTAPNILPLANISDITTSANGGVISCSFTSFEPISTTRSSASSYYLFLVYGPSRNGLIQIHQKTFISADKAALNTTVAVQLEDLRSAKAHGSLLLIAWMTTGSLGLLIARYLKGPTKGYCNKDLWFLAHVTLMSLSVILTSIAFIVIFAYAQDWFDSPHSVLGCIVMILTLIQPFAAIFRCQPSHKWRYLFNWGHALNGLAIKGLAVAAIFTGLNVLDTSANRWPQKVMGGFLGWELLFFLLFDWHAQWSQKEKEDTGSSSFLPQWNVKTILLIIFFLGNIMFLIAILCGIGLS